MHTRTSDTTYRSRTVPASVSHAEIAGIHSGHHRGRRAQRTAGVRHLLRPATSTAPAFPLGYVRQGPRVNTPALLLPGDPRVASVLPYRGLRARAARDGLDVLMVEHRGIGLSRLDLTGAELPPAGLALEAVVEDLVAVLDREDIDRAVVHGSAYGSHLAVALAARHPDRVAGMVLDSLALDGHAQSAAQSHARSLLWDGAGLATARAAALLREVVARGVPEDEALSVARTAYEAGGLPLLERLLSRHLAGRAGRSWRWLTRLSGPGRPSIPYVWEADRAGTPTSPGGPSAMAEPLDLRTLLPTFDWPTVVLSGDRDLRTPPPMAREAAGLLVDPLLVPLADTGHDALDTHQWAVLEAVYAVRDGELDQLTDRVGSVRRRGRGARVSTLVRAMLLADRGLPQRY